MARLRLLFICGRNRRRSPTAERLYRGDPRFEVRSAGTSESSQRRVQLSDLRWAELILVMEPKYAARMRIRFPAERFPTILSLDIPDDYEPDDEELIAQLTSAVENAHAEYETQLDC